MFPEYVRCKFCLADWVVYPGEEFDSARAMVQHVKDNHSPERGERWQDYLEQGVNRCRDGQHSMPHRGCFLR